MSLAARIHSQFAESIAAKKAAVDAMAPSIEAAVRLMYEALRHEGKIMA